MTSRKTILILAFVGYLLTGCAFSEKPSGNPTLPPLEDSLVEPCRKIPELPEAATVDTLIEWGLETVGRYTDCATRKQAVTEIYNHARGGE